MGKHINIRGKLKQYFGFIPIHISTGKGQVVCRPNHGPRVDVEQGTTLAWRAQTVACAQWIARVLATLHVLGNGAVVPCWNQSQIQKQFTQNVREGNNINHRLWG